MSGVPDLVVVKSLWCGNRRLERHGRGAAAAGLPLHPLLPSCENLSAGAGTQENGEGCVVADVAQVLLVPVKWRLPRRLFVAEARFLTIWEIRPINANTANTIWESRSINANIANTIWESRTINANTANTSCKRLQHRRVAKKMRIYLSWRQNHLFVLTVNSSIYFLCWRLNPPFVLASKSSICAGG
ncbi:hypothetical protein [Microbulbifer sp.]|uniref:hypothetical protein n=1 Tax=Microbulbifer sp. TaxID=1908541 RepID=UPI003F3BCFF3